MKSRSMMILMVLAVSLFGCEIKEPSTCITGSEKCETNQYLRAEGIYKLCGQDGEWSSELLCDMGCSDDNKRCTDHSNIPACRDEDAIQCFKHGEHDIAFKCKHKRWIPEVCRSGSCVDGAGCMDAMTVCSKDEINCYDIGDDIKSSLQISCNDGHWLMTYCKGQCDGSKCEDVATLNCGGRNCKVEIPGWEEGKCDSGQCIPSVCKQGFHINNVNLSNVNCEINDDLNCGRPGYKCGQNQRCNTETGNCEDINVTEQDCTPNEEKCSIDTDGHGLHYVCNHSGEWGSPETCPAGCNGNKCAAVENCQEGETKCLNSSTALKCSQNDWTVVPCLNGEVCHNNVCKQIQTGDSCTPSSEKCEDAEGRSGLYYLCDSSGEWSLPKECPNGCDGDHKQCASSTDPECKANDDCPENKICSSGRCVNKDITGCETSTSGFKCEVSSDVGGTEYICDPNTQKWEPYRVCPLGCNGEHCALPDIDKECDMGENFSMCYSSSNEANAEYVEYKCINHKWTPTQCPNGCDGNKCLEVKTCTKIMQVIPKCTIDNGKAKYGLCLGTSEDALELTLLDCVPENNDSYVCSEKTTYCAECKSGNTRCAVKDRISYVQSCSEAEYWVSVERCEYGCLSDGKPHCRPKPECTPGEMVCDGNTIRTCSTQGYWESGMRCDDNEYCQAYETPEKISKVACFSKDVECIENQQKCEDDTDKSFGAISICDRGKWVNDHACLISHGTTSSFHSCKSATECGSCNNISSPSCISGDEEGEPAVFSFCYNGETVETECHTSSCSDDKCLMPNQECRNDISTQIGYILTNDNNTLTKTRCDNSASCQQIEGGTACGNCLNGTTKCESIPKTDGTYSTSFSTCEKGQWVEEESPYSCKNDKELGECTNSPVICKDENNVGIVSGCVNGKIINETCKSVSCSGVECGDCINGEIICGEHQPSHVIAEQECVNGKYIINKVCDNGCDANSLCIK